MQWFLAPNSDSHLQLFFFVWIFFVSKRFYFVYCMTESPNKTEPSTQISRESYLELTAGVTLFGLDKLDNPNKFGKIEELKLLKIAECPLRYLTRFAACVRRCINW